MTEKTQEFKLKELTELFASKHKVALEDFLSEVPFDPKLLFLIEEFKNYNNWSNEDVLCLAGSNGKLRMVYRGLNNPTSGCVLLEQVIASDGFTTTLISHNGEGEGRIGIRHQMALETYNRLKEKIPGFGAMTPRDEKAVTEYYFREDFELNVAKSFLTTLFQLYLFR